MCLHSTCTANNHESVYKISCCGNAMSYRSVAYPYRTLPYLPYLTVPYRTVPYRTVPYVPYRAMPCHAMSHHNQHPSPLSPFFFRTTFHKNASRWKCCGGLIIKPEPLERQIKRFSFDFSKWNWCSRQCNFRDACRLGWDLETPDERGERRSFSHFSSPFSLYFSLKLLSFVLFRIIISLFMTVLSVTFIWQRSYEWVLSVIC